MAQRVTLPTRSPYNTKSNKRRVVKTPGGKLKYHLIGKQASPVRCGDCHDALPGVKSLRPRQYANVSKTKKTVSRAYGGSRCANCVRTRWVHSDETVDRKEGRNLTPLLPTESSVLSWSKKPKLSRQSWPVKSKRSNLGNLTSLLYDHDTSPILYRHIHI